MKKIILSLLFLVGIIGTASADYDKVITFEQLPAKAQQFVTKYFANEEILLIQQESRRNPNYEVQFSSGNEVGFDAKGEWLEVKNVQGVDNNLIPEKILTQVKNMYPNATITDIDRSDRMNIDIELDNNLDIKFNKKTFKILEIDK